MSWSISNSRAGVCQVGLCPQRVNYYDNPTSDDQQVQKKEKEITTTRLSLTFNFTKYPSYFSYVRISQVALNKRHQSCFPGDFTIYFPELENGS